VPLLRPGHRRGVGVRIPALIVLAFALAGSPAFALSLSHREPAVAGSFYPADPGALRAAVEGFLADAVPQKARDPVALVAPHAGYVFSGQVAADAWVQAKGGGYDLIVILGVNHTVPPFPGAAIQPGPGFTTPLGNMSIDRATAKALAAADPAFTLDAAPHEREHSVEVQVPFAQVLFPGAKLLPLVVGTDDPALCERMGRALGKALAGRRALIVASTDLSHYPAAADAGRIDRRTLAAISLIDPAMFRASNAGEMSRGVPGLVTCACGEAAVTVAMAAVRALGPAHGVVLSCANSGDSPAGDAERAVGYGAVAFVSGSGRPDLAALREPPPVAAPVAGGSLTAAERRALLSFARESIARYLATGTAPSARALPPRTLAPRGAFVTIKKRGDLRGCIGHMAEDTPLGRVVGGMALQAAFNDRRFPPVTADELPRLTIEISALTPMKPVAGAKEIVVGRDGVLLRKGGRSAVFLPQVATEQGWSRETMLDQLCLKAGLPAGAWREGASFSVFQAEVFGEGE
jgi:MEMO1 family protein